MTGFPEPSDTAFGRSAYQHARRMARLELDREENERTQKHYAERTQVSFQIREKALKSEHSAAAATAPSTYEDGHTAHSAASSLVNVSRPDRIITVLAVPFEQSTLVEYRGEIWREVFSRAAFDGINPTKQHIPVTAVLHAPATNHDGGRLVGKVTRALPQRADGLVLDVHISGTPAGDETLQLIDDGALSPSIGFKVRARDQHLDRRTMGRRIFRGLLEEVAWVPVPAYDDARVLATRSSTPRLVDDLCNDPVFQWTQQRVADAWRHDLRRQSRR